METSIRNKVFVPMTPAEKIPSPNQRDNKHLSVYPLKAVSLIENEPDINLEGFSPYQTFHIHLPAFDRLNILPIEVT